VAGVIRRLRPPFFVAFSGKRFGEKNAQKMNKVFPKTPNGEKTDEKRKLTIL